MLIAISVIQRAIATFMEGGPLMVPIAIVAFAIWIDYFVGYVRLRNLRGLAVRSTMELEEVASLLDCLRTLVVVAPLLGLLGTVLGMIETFQALVHGNVEMTTRLADGIHVALYTTQAGLMAALPGVAALAHLQHIYRDLDKEKPVARNPR